MARNLIRDKSKSRDMAQVPILRRPTIKIPYKRKQPRTATSHRSVNKYKPHQGKQEIARRLRK